MPLVFAGFAFWIWMMIDCATKEPSTGNDKLVWIIIIVFTQIVGVDILLSKAPAKAPRRVAENLGCHAAATIAVVTIPPP